MTAPTPTHSDAAHRAIEAELVRLTLGGRGPRRPELRVDLLGKVYQAARMVADHMRTSWLAAARSLSAASIDPRRFS